MYSSTTKSKLMFIFCFVVISVALLLIKNVEVTGYEISIYKSISFPIFLLLFPMLYSMINIFIFKSDRNNFLILNIIVFLMVCLIILLLPNIKGYTFYPMGDPPSHAGTVLDIISHNKIPEDLIYPITHIFISSTYYITNIDFNTITMFAAPIYSIVAMIYLYVLAHHIFNDSYKAILVVLLGFFPLSTVIPSPHIFTVLSILLVLFIFMRIINHNRIEDKIILIIFAILYPFFHPMVSIIFAISILLIGILYKFIHRSKQIGNSAFFIIPSISLIILLLWLWSKFWYWNYHIGRVLRWFISDTTDKGRFQNAISMFNDYSINIIDLVIKVYIQNIIYIIFSFLAIFLIIKKFVHEYKNVNEKLMLLSVWIFLNVFIGFAVLFLPTEGSPERLLYYTGILSPIFVVYLLFSLRKNVKYVIIIVLIVLNINSVYVVHQSDYIDLPNFQVTQMEIVGSNWLIDQRNHDLQVKSNHERFYRIADLIKGPEYAEDNKLDIDRSTAYGTEPYKHFGYNNYTRIGDGYNKDFYLIIEKYDEVLYFVLYPNSIKFNKSDFNRLDFLDSTAKKIYNNGEFKVQLVKGTNMTQISVII